MLISSSKQFNSCSLQGKPRAPNAAGTPGLALSRVWFFFADAAQDSFFSSCETSPEAVSYWEGGLGQQRHCTCQPHPLDGFTGIGSNQGTTQISFFVPGIVSALLLCGCSCSSCIHD